MAIPRKQLLHDTRSTWISALRSTSRVEAGRAVPSPPGGSRTKGVRRRTRPQDHQHRGPILLGPDWMERHAPGLGGQMPPLHAPTRTPRPHREPTCPPAFARRLTPPDVRKRMVRVAFTSPRLFRRLALHARVPRRRFRSAARHALMSGAPTAVSRPRDRRPPSSDHHYQPLDVGRCGVVPKELTSRADTDYITRGVIAAGVWRDEGGARWRSHSAPPASGASGGVGHD